MGRVPAESGITELYASFIDQGRDLLTQIQAVEITDPEAFEFMATLGRIGKKMAEAIDDQFKTRVREADEKHKELLRVRRIVTEFFAKAEEESKAKLLKAHEEFPDLGVEGTSFSTVWRAEIVDEKLVPREFMSPDTTKIQKMATALGEECAIPGVRVYKRTQVAYRGQ